MRALLRSCIAGWELMSIASAQYAHIYLPCGNIATPSSAATTASLEPTNARLILAQRLGLSQFHSLRTISDEAIDALNLFTAGSQHLSVTSDPRILLFIDGLASGQDQCSTLQQSMGFDIMDAPSFDANTRLLDDFIAQAHYTSDRNSFATIDFMLKQTLFDSFGSIKPTTAEYEVSVKRGVAIARLSLGQRNGLSTDSGVICQAIDALRHEAYAKSYELTIAIFARGDSKNDEVKCDSDSLAWGTYKTPLIMSRRQFEDGNQGNSAGGLSGMPATSLESEPTTTRLSSTASSAPRSGILPSRFPSKESCESATDFCSGRGSCEVRQNYTESNDEKRSYACVCRTDTHETSNGGTKTTRWGGPACQKKDIGMEFWLLAGFTLLFIGILTWALGMLYSMGQEELPSVIGAGVAGPRIK